MNPDEPSTAHVALVTGASRGIGRAIAMTLAGAGWDIAFSYLKDNASARTVAEAIRGLGRRSCSYQSDAARSEEAERLVENARRDLGRIDVLVANAGIAGATGWEDLSLEEWRRGLETNLLGPYWIVRAAAAELKRRRGNVVLVASIAGLSAYPEELAYSAAKAGVLSLSRSLALALAPEVRVNAVAPGWVRTDMTADLYSHPKARRAIERGIPRGRWGEPEDVAHAVLFLASDGARFITGETLVVDGGDLNVWRMGFDRDDQA